MAPSKSLSGRVIDETPKTPLAREKLRVEQLEQDVLNANEECIHLRRQVAGLKSLLSKRQETDVKHQTANQIALYYKHRLKRKGRWKFGDKRRKAVVGRLGEDFDVEYICRAIDGVAIGASQNQDTGVKYDDLEFVCRNEVHLERFHDLAEKNNAPTLIGPVWRSYLTGEIDANQLEAERKLWNQTS